MIAKADAALAQADTVPPDAADDPATVSEHLLACGGSLRQLLGIDGVRLEVLYSYGCRLFRERKHEEARQIFFALTAIDPLSFDYTLSLGICLQKLRRHDEAIFCLSRAVTRRLTDPRPWYLVGVSFQIEGDVGRAMASYRAAAKASKGLEEYRELHAQALQSLAMLEQGERE
ncbi:hypothetical protein [Cupriavidus sp. AU9028]|uniref:hypothetical protein n=1 Tax=Cupriavidus sp. AU9028 TaxID=2871157 RepID=UPI001C985179|nr:hypothetical protein [Cupriavidus sp. AU9028]MBY4897893.1 hypothetical protein [Cupriavidus sp. AU9028]